MTSAAALKRRWTSPSGRALAADVLRRLQAGEPLDDLVSAPSTGASICAASRSARYSHLRGVRFDRVALPKDPDLVLVHAAEVFDGADALARAGLDPQAASVATAIFALLRRPRTPGVSALLNLRDLKPDGEAIGAVLVAADGIRQG